MVPDYLQDLKPEKSTPGRYMFRNKDEFVPPEWRLRTYQKSFLPFAVSLWNSLEENTRTIPNYERFKETLMGTVNDNPLFHLGTRQEQILMARLRMRFSDLKGHLHSMKIIESSARSCGFKNEDEIHFFLACPLYYRPRVTLLNIIKHPILGSVCVCVCVIRFFCKYFLWRGHCRVVCRAQSFSSE